MRRRDSTPFGRRLPGLERRARKCGGKINPPESWIRSEEPAHPAIITRAEHEAVLARSAETGHAASLTPKQSQGRVPGVDISTVYRTLQLLEDIEVVRHSHQEEGAAYHRAGQADHVHLTCSCCGRQDELPPSLAERLKTLILAYHGFEPDLTHFAIAGLCVDCQGESTCSEAAKGISPTSSD